MKTLYEYEPADIKMGDKETGEKAGIVIAKGESVSASLRADIDR